MKPAQAGFFVRQDTAHKAKNRMITLGVDDLPRAVRFYEQGLSFPRKEPAEDARMAAQCSEASRWKQN